MIVLNFQVSSFVSPFEADATKAVCLICPGNANCPRGKPFCIKEGFCAITKHADSKKHKELLAEAQANPEHNLYQKQARQISVQDALKNQADQAEKASEVKNQLLKSQIIWCNFVHSHGLSSEVFNCTTRLFPLMFPDSELARQWGQPKKGMKK